MQPRGRVTNSLKFRSAGKELVEVRKHYFKCLAEAMWVPSEYIFSSLRDSSPLFEHGTQPDSSLEPFNIDKPQRCAASDRSSISRHEALFCCRDGSPPVGLPKSSWVFTCDGPGCLWEKRDSFRIDRLEWHTSWKHLSEFLSLCTGVWWPAWG